LYRHQQAVDLQLLPTDTPFTLLILAIPDYLTPQDFLQLMSEHMPSVIHGRMLQDCVPSRYMLLLQFSNLAAATLFFNSFNGKPFNSFEQEICHVVWIKQVLISSSEELFPHHQGEGVNTPRASATPSSSPSRLALALKSVALEGSSATPNKDDKSRLSLHNTPGDVVEMPTCPVCLDRMDSSVTGLFTSLCHHTFHCTCIMKWGDTTCPVCRFNSAKLGSEPGQNLWICLVCAHVGCGRYISGHARVHFEESGHVYSLELETQRVWDYVGDGYVHRLIQNHDGKLVHLPPPSTPDRPASRAGLDMLLPDALYSPQDIQVAEKMQQVGSEYQELITRSLNQQREYHEQQLDKIELSSVDRIMHLEGIINALEEENSRLWQERKDLTDRVKESSNKTQKLEAKLEKVLSRLVLAEKQVQEETILNSRLMENYTSLSNQLTDKEMVIQTQSTEIAELKEQVRDIMFFLETREKVGVVEGIEDASIVGVVPSPAVQPSPSRSKKKKK
ncbi:hypothetical protein HDV03_001192, partial [Kappamyces sp. JEL0829]